MCQSFQTNINIGGLFVKNALQTALKSLKVVFSMGKERGCTYHTPFLLPRKSLLAVPFEILISGW